MLFLKKQVSFLQIRDILDKVLQKISITQLTDFDVMWNVDAQARNLTSQVIKELC